MLEEEPRKLRTNVTTSMKNFQVRRRKRLISISRFSPLRTRRPFVMLPSSTSTT
ncbi:hypothetical protein LEMLEM_LOCUS13317 [Lemmus lemmus]